MIVRLVAAETGTGCEAGSGNCLEIPDSSRSGRFAPQLQLDLTLDGATG